MVRSTRLYRTWLDTIRFFNRVACAWSILPFRKITDPNEPNLSRLHQRLHGSHRFPDRHVVIRPVKLIQINIVGVQALQALLRRPDYVRPAKISGGNLVARKTLSRIPLIACPTIPSVP